MQRIIRRPERRQVQADGRIRMWGYADSVGGYLRVVLLSDGDRAQCLPRRGLPTVSLPLSYDKATDSLYIELRPLPAKRTRKIADDVMIDLGEDGEPVGYDLQHAWAKRDLIISIILGDEPRAAAE